MDLTEPMFQRTFVEANRSFPFIPLQRPRHDGRSDTLRVRQFLRTDSITTMLAWFVVASSSLLLAGCEESGKWSFRPLQPHERQSMFRSSMMDSELAKARVDRESTSLTLEPEQLQRFLRIFSAVVDGGIDHRILEKLRQTVDSLNVGETESVTFPVTLDAEVIDLEIQLFLDETNVVDVYFFSLSNLISLIEEQAGRFEAARSSPGFDMDLL